MAESDRIQLSVVCEVPALFYVLLDQKVIHLSLYRSVSFLLLGRVLLIYFQDVSMCLCSPVSGVRFDHNHLILPKIPVCGNF